MAIHSSNLPSYLVTGGAGFIGRHVASYLVTKGKQVVVLDDLSGGYRENVPDQTLFIEGSIGDRALINQLFEQYQFEKVFHLAAYAAENLSHFIKRYNYENNLLGSVNLINAAVNHGTKCFVFTSSAAVYGSHHVPLHEEMVPAPEDSYGVAKWAVEYELKLSRQLFSLNSVVFRPHNVYGEYQNTGDPYRNVIGIFLRQLMNGEPLTIFGDGEQTRAFTHVDDVASTIVQTAEDEKTYNNVFNLGSDDQCTLNRLAEIVQTSFGRQTPVIHLPSRHEVKHVKCSHEKAKRLLGYTPKVGLEEGVRRMTDWVKKNGVRRSKEFAEIEIWKNMPPSWIPSKIPAIR